MDPIVKLKTYIVEDNATIRENLIGTLEELASVESVGAAATEDEGKSWLAAHPAHWDLAIVDLFLRQGSGLGVLAACRPSGCRAAEGADRERERMAPLQSGFMPRPPRRSRLFQRAACC